MNQPPPSRSSDSLRTLGVILAAVGSVVFLGGFALGLSAPEDSRLTIMGVGALLGLGLEVAGVRLILKANEAKRR